MGQLGHLHPSLSQSHVAHVTSEACVDGAGEDVPASQEILQSWKREQKKDGARDKNERSSYSPFLSQHRQEEESLMVPSSAVPIPHADRSK